MGKVEDLRAMREARYSAAAARTTQRGLGPLPGRTAARPARPEVPAPPARPAAAPAAGPAATPANPAAAPAADLCGHRAMTGKTCIRPSGHSEASHRYAKG